MMAMQRYILEIVYLKGKLERLQLQLEGKNQRKVILWVLRKQYQVRDQAITKNQLSQPILKF